MMVMVMEMVMALAGAAFSASVSVNTTSVSSGDFVRVDFAAALRNARQDDDLRNIPEMRTEWRIDRSDSTGGHSDESGPAHAEPKCVVLPTPNTTSYWLGAFSPPVAASAVKMGSSPISPSYPTEGTPPYTIPAPTKFISGTQLANGFHDFQMTNMRAEVNFVLFAGSLSSPEGFEVLAVSSNISFKDAEAPMHGRLARTSNTNEMRLTWTSSSPCTKGTCIVQWGLSPTSLTRTTTAEPGTTYSASDLCGRPANNSGYHSPGYFHSAVLDLSSESTADRLSGVSYWYRFGELATGMSPTYSFKAPKPASPDTSLSILVTADMGETYEDGSQYHWEEPAAVNTTVNMKGLANSLADGVDIIFHPGDLSYATGYESEWDRFMEQIEPLATSAPYMTGQGNHERDFPHAGMSIGTGDSGGECGVPTQARFLMPTCAEPNVKPCIGSPGSSTPGNKFNGPPGPSGPANDGWYSINQGPVHFLMMNTEMNSSVDSRQWEFIDSDLAAVDRSVTPWVIILGHRQMYSGNVMEACNAMGDVEPLLLKYKVDLALWGHIHFAQQSCPMYKGKCVTQKDAAGYDAPIHAVIGNAGQSLTKVPTEKAAWSLYNAAEWGFSHIDVQNSTHLTMRFFGDVPLDETAPVHHTFTIIRSFPRV